MIASKSRLSKTTISTRLAFAFSTLLILLVILTAIGIYQVNQINRGLTSINDVNGAKQRFAVDMRGSVHDRAIALRDIVMTTDASRLTTLNEEMRQLAVNYDTAIEGMQRVISDTDTTPQEQSILSSISTQADIVEALTQQVLDARTSDTLTRAQAITLEQAGPAYAEWLNRINQFINLQEQINNASTAAARSTASGFQMQMLGLTLFAVVIGGAIALFLSRQLLRELGAEPYEVKAFAEAIGRGELTNQPTLKAGDTRSIMASQVAMSKQLQSIVAQVRSSADAVASNSEQIAEGNNDLSSRTEQQASALAETASAMEQLNSTVKLNADNSQQASQEAASASKTATEGGEAVRQVVTTMNELNKSSQEIAGIISTIDAIAFQTNILALNASVEAARAGEHGRGFAVVAEEVRNLAQRSADAAREINDLISNNLERVNNGNARAEEASRSTENIVAAIGRVTRIMQEISHASAEQSTGVQEVGQAITEMDQVTQQNAALVEESANAANHLRQNAHQLLDAMSVFKLPAGQQHTYMQAVVSRGRTQDSTAHNAPNIPVLKRQTAESSWDSF
ncbi:MCP four helix bundle domain-containing protein [Halomonas qaidamensis]|uniref:MCP four helix bundle domain-containing protein n=1 Tax=Halomonas qaidamensis TaxID=2866211 RepID=A0ABY6JS98_9GAMM|nr:methyl-accepting chemotaxis protein [Halomonas qaidamensis]UYV19545.1 MCP four helix bundle domain-containing protein [Halomonas qaidamensis]